VLKEGDPLPSVRTVAADYRVNPLTVLKGYQQLVDEGPVKTRRGRGMFINAGARSVLLQGERQKFLGEEWPRVYATIQRLGMTAEELLDGAGKTTALNAILGLTAYEGELHVLGRDPWTERDRLMRDVCFIADVAVLPRWLRVSQALDYVAGVHPRFDRAKADAFLAKTSIRRTSRIRELSKGTVPLTRPRERAPCEARGGCCPLVALRSRARVAAFRKVSTKSAQA
jgi:DNA-binding transcriptional regulator YhcF (GntR family)